jgi:Uma2 family endonuclease
MADGAPKLMTVAEFLEWDDGTDTRYELVRGRPVAMAPPLRRHGKIMGNLYAALRQRLKPPGDVGLQVGIVRPDRDDLFYEADVAIGCGEPVDDAKMLADPMVVFEVLSPSTERHDRGLKVQDYRAIATVQDRARVKTQ